MFETVLKLINRVVNKAGFSSIHSDFNNAPRFSDTGFFWFSKDRFQGLGVQFFSKDNNLDQIAFLDTGLIFLCFKISDSGGFKDLEIIGGFSKDNCLTIQRCREFPVRRNLFDK